MKRWRTQERDESYWPAFADMMSVTALVLFFTAMVAFVQSVSGIKLADQGTKQVQQIFEERAHTTQALLKAIGEGAVTLGENATLRFKSDVLFTYDSDTLKPDAKPLLSEVAQRLERVLQAPEYRNAIAGIMVEGHTAGPPDDPRYYQWVLGARRAARVIDFFQESSPLLRDPDVAGLFGASSFSYYRPTDKQVPIGRCEGDEQCAKYRRIEIRIILRDDKLRDEIMKALGVG